MSKRLEKYKRKLKLESEVIERIFYKSDKEIMIDLSLGCLPYPEYLPPLDYDKVIIKNLHTGETKTFYNY